MGREGGSLGQRREEPSSSRRRTVRGGDENAVVRWLLIDGSRNLLVAVLSVVVFCVVLALGLAGVVGPANASLVGSLFTSAITGVFTLVSITISINQLVLSRIIGSPEDLEEWAESVDRFRDDVAEMDPRVSVSPTEPAAFLSLVTRAVRERTLRLREVYDGRHDPATTREVEATLADLLALTEHVNDSLSTGDRALIDVLSPVLNNSYSRHINSVRRVRATVTDLSEVEQRALDEVEEALEQIDLTRHYFKTLQLHVELASVSRLMLLTGFPAVLLSALVILFYARGPVPVGRGVQLVLVSAATSFVLVPLGILLAYGIRVATIAKRTTSFGTFTPIDEMP